jgi:hypothetical protein
MRSAMVGLERSTLPLVGWQNFHLASSAAVLFFIDVRLVCGSRAITSWVSGRPPTKSTIARSVHVP